MVEVAAVMEAKEEVSLDVKLIALLGIYSDPSRDSRGHTITACYVAEASASQLLPTMLKTARYLILLRYQNCWLSIMQGA
jgi:ADP-ribose pyrophosphatase YjhB (NUDIX family)